MKTHESNENEIMFFHQLFNQLTIIAKQWREPWIISTLHKLKLKTSKIESMGAPSKNTSNFKNRTTRKFTRQIKTC